jgi:hypothetical protein
MNTKPILFWPKPRSDIEAHLNRGEDDFLVVDTNCDYELQKLYNITRATAIFDPFPQYGEHYRDFSDHVAASACKFHIVGLEACRTVLRALKDPSLAHSSMEELLTATTPAGSGAKAAGRMALFSRSAIFGQRSMKIPVDWSYLNWPNTLLLAILVFAASLTGNLLFFDNSLIASMVATFVFAAAYVCARINVRNLFFSSPGRTDSATETFRHPWSKSISTKRAT